MNTRIVLSEAPRRIGVSPFMQHALTTWPRLVQMAVSGAVACTGVVVEVEAVAEILALNH